MLKVLLVDDEPFIIQGLKVLIDWEQEGFMIAGTASNGKEAYDFLQKEEVDLIIADIQMPVMTGLELQETIRKENLSNAYFVILSGYADFEYA
ncbi:MAG: response regulator, partial [Lachnobacterium sp.]|nr:response regulator [Lachnobacterium sp.]